MSKTLNFIEPFTSIKSFINKKHNIYEQRHLERDGNSVKIVSDGFVDADKEIASELKNAGLQNILKMQAMRYGTLENAIARANDKGVYVDVSKIPTDLAGQEAFVAKAQSQINKLKAELGLTDDDLSGLTQEKLIQLYKAKYESSSTGSAGEGGAE